MIQVLNKLGSLTGITNTVSELESAKGVCFWKQGELLAAFNASIIRVQSVGKIEVRQMCHFSHLTVILSEY
jgi:hypothetical protein